MFRFQNCCIYGRHVELLLCEKDILIILTKTIT